MTSPESPPAVPARRGRGRPGHDQATVLRTAVGLFNRRGYDATSIGDLAAELGVTKSAIYHHVAGKEDLLRLALDDALDELTAVVSAAVSDERASAYDRLRGVVRRSVEVLAAHQPAVTLLLRVRGNTPVEVEALKRRRWLDDQLAALVRAAIAEGALREDVAPDLVSRLLFGMVNSLVEWYRPEGTHDTATIADAIASIAFDGLAPR
ncbi:putative TetR-family transcriptional regulator [Actinoplanes missouriensis 431]|uniref:Putative TetR-family transcriptional regulator n=1 Tax=Actinoplanes missouriensis (strain ATCC 14538 / DSM 43046 / CBS 188.64 / JCM 3121 / NBRC 102363 / NCIMB 12654 / NRRL B-3342 / UNCC 431) TaxID=512565 RepID=I0H977_ACTM4|nr:TetR/AcrR family transcriptional regulator [Actinoplanes missouriensis]BAL89564.1 putative TetR-family transcriptional regulator [Actinoplanes missouriensis 431]